MLRSSFIIFAIMLISACGKKELDFERGGNSVGSEYINAEVAWNSASQGYQYPQNVASQGYPYTQNQPSVIVQAPIPAPAAQHPARVPTTPTSSNGLCKGKAIQASAYSKGRVSVQKQNMGSAYIVYYPANIDQITGGGGKCKLPVIGWANGMTVGQGGAWPSDLVYGKTIRTVASHGYIVVAAQVEGMQGKDGTQVARGVEQVISNSKWSRYASRSAVGNMGHSMGGGATLYAGKLLSKSGRKVALCPIQGAPGPSTSNAPTLYLSGTGDPMDSGWASHRNSAGTKMFSQIKGASHMSWYFNADSNQYGGACAMWYDCYLKSESGACSLARGGKFFKDLSGKWTAPEYK